MISPEAPYPLDGGGALRTASLLHYLGEHYDLDLIVFRHPGQRISEFLPQGLVRQVAEIDLRQHANDFGSRAWRNGVRLLRGRPPLIDRFSGYDDAIARAIDGRVYDVAILEHFWLASYLPHAHEFARRVVVNLHNVESEWHASCARTGGLPESAIHRAFGHAARRMEAQSLRLSDLALTTSADDTRRVQAIAPGLATCVYPNAIPLRTACDTSADSATNGATHCSTTSATNSATHFSATSATNSEPELSIAFSGNLEYEPNRVGLAGFLRDSWPRLKQRFPDLIFRVIGKNAHAIADLVEGQAGVECTGPVEDPFAHLARARVCIAPLRSGSGTRLKIIEAWAARRAVVSTTIGAEGLGAVNGQSILIADDPADFAEAVSRVLTDAPFRQKLAISGRELYERKFTWNAAWDSLSGSL